MRSRWRSVLSLCFFLALVVACVVALRSGYFSVKQITCQTDQGECPDYVQAELNNKLGSSLFFTDFYGVGNRVTQLAPFLAHFQITKKFPDTVQYTFTTAQPIYIFVDTNQQPWLIDEAGYVVATAEAKLDKPTVYAAPSYYFEPGVRDRVSPELHQSILYTLASTKELLLTQAKVTILNPEDAQLQLPNGKVATFTLSHALPQLSKLTYLLGRFDFTTIKEPVTDIDLRFSQVILRTASGSATPTATKRTL